MTSHARGSVLAPVCLAVPEPGDFCCVPVSGAFGAGIEVGEFLAARLQHQPAELRPYDHAEIYVGQADAAGPHGYTYSAYPDRRGKKPLPCPPAELPGSVWSSGLYLLTPAQRQGIVSWCEAHPSVSYSWLDYDAIAAHALHLPIPGLRGYIASDGHYICSQYTDTGWLEGGGIHLFNDGRWPGYVTPWDLADLLLTRAHLAALTPET